MEFLIDFLSIASPILDGDPVLQLSPQWEQLAIFISYNLWCFIDRGALGLWSENGKDCFASITGAGIFVPTGIRTGSVGSHVNFQAFLIEPWSPQLGPRICSCRMNS
jgi:hypothetical protein